MDEQKISVVDVGKQKVSLRRGLFHLYFPNTSFTSLIGIENPMPVEPSALGL